MVRQLKFWTTFVQTTWNHRRNGALYSMSFQRDTKTCPVLSTYLVSQLLVPCVLFTLTEFQQRTARYWNSWNSVLTITWFNCNWLQCDCNWLQSTAIESNETQYGEKATYFQHSPLNSRTLVNHEPTMITASPNIHQTAAVVSNWQALLVLFEIERKKFSQDTERDKTISRELIGTESRFEIMWTWSDMFCKRW